MKELPTVTLIGYDGPLVDRTVRVMNYCQNLFRFAAVKLWCSHYPTLNLSNGDILPCDEGGHKGAQEFEIRGFKIDTPHCLFVSHDGFIVNPGMWDDSWLQWDYIGAPWRSDHIPPINGKVHLVGNSGFCLRSKRFLEVSKASFTLFRPEMLSDVFLCRIAHELFEAAGIKYAPLEVANNFAFESRTGGAELKLWISWKLSYT